MLNRVRKSVESLFLGTNQTLPPMKSVMTSEGLKEEVMVADFRNWMPQVPSFRQINDNVMGGVSTGGIAWDQKEGAAKFSGVLSTENNGGFASVRSQPSEELKVEGSTGMKMLVKGDGRLYKVNARMDDGYDGISYQEDFRPTNEWTEISLMFEDFKPNFRGMLLPIVTPLEGDKIKQIGFMVSKLTDQGQEVEDFKTGPFELFIKWIKYF
eukprot:TRINITY_DN2756_c0_g1_i1.p1 TRINITY_DN2756_c0_g1~~TRINITY_DN2756_c0_g1_i1.p1  ORF type:complete len:211 (-),score=25.79 TRINITY_DN2756_c0_g1_i1:110-742(-)